MAESNPTGDSRLVPLDLPDGQKKILRERLADWLAGIRSDLEMPERVTDIDGARAEAAAFERLLAALDRGGLEVPDEAARSALRAAVAAYDEASGYTEATANHEAMEALLDRLGGKGP